MEDFLRPCAGLLGEAGPPFEVIPDFVPFELPSRQLPLQLYQLDLNLEIGVFPRPFDKEFALPDHALSGLTQIGMSRNRFNARKVGGQVTETSRQRIAQISLFAGVEFRPVVVHMPSKKLLTTMLIRSRIAGSRISMAGLFCPGRMLMNDPYRTSFVDGHQSAPQTSSCLLPSSIKTASQSA